MSQNLVVKEFMTPTPHCIEPHESITVALQRMRANLIRHLPVRSGRKIVGMLSENDINFAMRFLEEGAAVSEVMISDPFKVTDEESLHVVAQRMVDEKISSAVVAAGDDTILGIFTYVDALKALIKLTK